MVCELLLVMLRALMTRIRSQLRFALVFLVYLRGQKRRHMIWWFVWLKIAAVSAKVPLKLLQGSDPGKENTWQL